MVCESVGDDSVKGRKNLHGELGLDTAFVDKVVEGISKTPADAATM